MKTEYALQKPFHLENVLKSHGWFQLPPFYWNEAEKSIDWILAFDSTVIKLNLVQKNIDFITVSSEEEYDPDIIHPLMTRVFNLDLELDGFYHVCHDNPLLADLKQKGMGRLMRNACLYEDVFKSICGTNVQWKQAVNMTKNIAAIGDEYKNSQMYCFPSADQILEAGEDFLKEIGRVGYRSGYLMDLCKRVSDNDPLVAKADNGELDEEELYRLLLSFKGIGTVTANYLMALYGYYNRMSIDSLVISYMRKRHFDGTTPTVKQIDAFFDHYGKWKYLVYWMEFIVTQGWKPDETQI